MFGLTWMLADTFPEAESLEFVGVMTRRIVDLSDLPVIDGHCHPLLLDPWTVAPDEFLGLFTEGRADTMTEHIPHTGYFYSALRDFARRLGTEEGSMPSLSAGANWGCPSLPQAQRKPGGGPARRHGYPPGAMPLGLMRQALPTTVHARSRVETCAQSLLEKGLVYEEFLVAFREDLRAAARGAVAFKSIIAYRSGLAIQAWTADEASRAHRVAMARVQAGGSTRLTEKPLLDTLVEVTLDVCQESGRPLFSGPHRLR